MDKASVYSVVKDYLAEQFFCSAQVLEGQGTYFAVNTLCDRPFLRMLAFQQSVVVATSAPLFEQVQGLLSDKNRDEIFEFPFIYGQTIHYLPDGKGFCEAPLPGDYSFELVEGNDIKKFVGITGFDNSLVFDDQGNTGTKIVLVARQGASIAAIAGAGAETELLWEVGVDVLPRHRKSGLATKLVSHLSAAIMRKGVVPFYSVSVTNLASQMVAARSGYLPCWLDSYGTVLDGSSPYPQCVQNLVL